MQNEWEEDDWDKIEPTKAMMRILRSCECKASDFKFKIRKIDSNYTEIDIGDFLIAMPNDTLEAFEQAMNQAYAIVGADKVKDPQEKQWFGNVRKFIDALERRGKTLQ